MGPSTQRAETGDVPKYLELRRHTDNRGDALTPEGVVAAVALGRRLRSDYEGEYAAVWTSGAQRATQTAACVIAGWGSEIPGGVHVQLDLRSTREADWRAAYADAGAGDLESLRDVAPDLVIEDGAVLGSALRTIFGKLREGERALAFGHSPTNEAGVLGLTGIIVPPMGKGAGVLITNHEPGYDATSLD